MSRSNPKILFVALRMGSFTILPMIKPKMLITITAAIKMRIKATTLDTVIARGCEIYFAIISPAFSPNSLYFSIMEATSIPRFSTYLKNSDSN